MKLFFVIIMVVLGFSLATPSARADDACNCLCTFSGGGSDSVGIVDDQAACQTSCAGLAPEGESVAAADCTPVPRPEAAPGAAAPAGAAVPGALYQGGAVVENLAETANPIGTTSVASFAGKTINVIMGILGSIALLMFIWGGFLWLTSAGNADRITKGKNTLIWATIGLALIFAAYAVVNFVLTRLIGVL